MCKILLVTPLLPAVGIAVAQISHNAHLSTFSNEANFQLRHGTSPGSFAIELCFDQVTKKDSFASF